MSVVSLHCRDVAEAVRVWVDEKNNVQTTYNFLQKYPKSYKIRLTIFAYQLTLQVLSVD